MTDPTGAAPNQDAPAPPPAAPVPPPEGGHQAPPPAAAPPPPAAAPAPPPAQGGYQAPQAGQSFTAPNLQQAAVEAGPAPGIVYADLVTRIIAIVIDGLIIGIPYWILSGIIVTALLFSGGALAFMASLVLGVLYVGLAGAYFVWTWTTQRATYGMKFLKLECVNAADGATLTRDQAIKRFAFLYAGALLGFVGSNVLGYGIGSLLGLAGAGYSLYLLYTASQSSKRQGFHDVQAGTVVVKHI